MNFSEIALGILERVIMVIDNNVFDIYLILTETDLKK